MSILKFGEFIGESIGRLKLNLDDKENVEAVSAMRISDLEELSNRTKGVLIRNGIVTVGDMLDVMKDNPYAIMYYAQMGKRAETEIEEFLDNHNLTDSLYIKHRGRRKIDVSTPIEDVPELLTRTKNCLIKNGILTVNDLLDKDENFFYRFMGRKSVDNIRDVFDAYNLNPLKQWKR